MPRIVPSEKPISIPNRRKYFRYKKRKLLIPRKKIGGRIGLVKTTFKIFLPFRSQPPRSGPSTTSSRKPATHTTSKEKRCPNYRKERPPHDGKMSLEKGRWMVKNSAANGMIRKRTQSFKPYVEGFCENSCASPSKTITLLSRCHKETEGFIQDLHDAPILIMHRSHGIQPDRHIEHIEDLTQIDSTLLHNLSRPTRRKRRSDMYLTVEKYRKVMKAYLVEDTAKRVTRKSSIREDVAQSSRHKKMKVIQSAT